jgi:hypothetical protein
MGIDGPAREAVSVGKDADVLHKVPGGMKLKHTARPVWLPTQSAIVQPIERVMEGGLRFQCQPPVMRRDTHRILYCGIERDDREMAADLARVGGVDRGTLKH